MLSASNVRFGVLDVTDAESVKAFVEKELTDKKVNVLINNAGVLKDAPASEELARMHMDANLFGVINLTDAVVPHLADNARVLVMASGLGELNAFYSDERRATIKAADSAEKVRALGEEFIADCAKHGAESLHKETGWREKTYTMYGPSKALVNQFVRASAKQNKDVFYASVCPGW